MCRRIQKCPKRLVAFAPHSFEFVETRHLALTLEFAQALADALLPVLGRLQPQKRNLRVAGPGGPGFLVVALDVRRRDSYFLRSKPQRNLESPQALPLLGIVPSLGQYA
jgi:hypothetical protein